GDRQLQAGRGHVDEAALFQLAPDRRVRQEGKAHACVDEVLGDVDVRNDHRFRVNLPDVEFHEQLVPINRMVAGEQRVFLQKFPPIRGKGLLLGIGYERSEEHTSELQSRENLVCRLLLEKK